MVNVRQLLISFVLCLAFLSGPGRTQSLTAISDTVTKPDGSVFNGIVKITWTGGSGSSVAPTTSSARVYAGLISVLLVPTTTVSPCAYYTVAFTSNDGQTTWTQLWYVPLATATLTIAEVLTVSTACTTSSGGGGGTGGGGSGSTVAVPIPISDVSGLSVALAAKTNMGASYNPSTTAWIDSSGNIGSIPGNSTDCVKVNGTSGPCSNLAIPFPISDVIGLSAALAAKTNMGASYNPSTTAWIDSSGNIGSIPGNSTDCVKVNGTSGPCSNLSIPFPIADVTGLSAALAAKTNMGASYNPSTTAWIDSSGNIGSIPGNSTDCVKVNGTSGPCSNLSIPFPIADVTGLSTALAAKPNMGTSYNPSTTAWIDSSETSVPFRETQPIVSRLMGHQVLARIYPSRSPSPTCPG